MSDAPTTDALAQVQTVLYTIQYELIGVVLKFIGKCYRLILTELTHLWQVSLFKKILTNTAVLNNAIVYDKNIRTEVGYSQS